MLEQVRGAGTQKSRGEGRGCAGEREGRGMKCQLLSLARFEQDQFHVGVAIFTSHPHSAAAQSKSQLGKPKPRIPPLSPHGRIQCSTLTVRCCSTARTHTCVDCLSCNPSKGAAGGRMQVHSHHNRASTTATATATRKQHRKPAVAMTVCMSHAGQLLWYSQFCTASLI